MLKYRLVLLGCVYCHSPSVNTHRMHWGSSWNLISQRWFGLHMTPFFQHCVLTCVRGHIEGMPTQLISSVKQEEKEEEETATRGWMERTPLALHMVNCNVKDMFTLLTCQCKQQMFVNTTFQITVVYTILVMAISPDSLTRWPHYFKSCWVRRNLKSFVKQLQ